MSSLSSKMAYRTLGKTNLRVSSIGLGCATLGSVYRQISNETCMNIVKTGLESGINLLDVSPFYGITKAETNTGNVLYELDKDKTHPRNSYILCTKTGRYAENKFDFSYTRTQQSIEESLNRLKTDYIDVLSIHDTEFAPINRGGLKQIWEETLPCLEELKAKGKIRHIGLSGRPLVVLDYIARNYGYDKIDTFLTYDQYGLLDDTLLHYVYRIKKYNIGIIQGGATFMGLLTKRGVPHWHNSSKELQDLCQFAVQKVEELYANKKCEYIENYAITRLALLYTHNTLKDVISNVLVGCSSVENLEKNIKWANDELTDDENDIINYLINDLFADYFNLHYIEEGTHTNIAEATIYGL